MCSRGVRPGPTRTSCAFSEGDIKQQINLLKFELCLQTFMLMEKYGYKYFMITEG